MRIILALLIACISTALLQAAEKPNIVLLISDDHDFEHFGFMGHPTVRTPNLDRLAGAGTVFTTGYLPTSVCRPSLASLLTGRLPHQSGIYANYLQSSRIGEDTRHADPTDSLAGHLRKAGYANCVTGKFWEGDARRQGFTHGTAEISFRGFLRFVRGGQRELFEFIDEHAGRKPMFIWWAPMLPHLPHNPSQRSLDLYPPESIVVPDYVKPERRESFIEDERKLLAMTTWLDEGVGELVEKLRRSGELDRTLFVFLTDNGWANGLPSKHSGHEKSLRTPVFFTWPSRIPEGRRIDGLLDTIDIYPTLLAYAGAPSPDTAAGRSLRPILEDRQLPEPRPVFAALYPHYASGGGVSPAKDLLALIRRDERWKIVWYLRDFTLDSVGIPSGQKMLVADFVAHPAAAVTLFDLRSDPYEQHDLSRDPAHREKIPTWKSEMLDWWRETGGESVPHLSPTEGTR